MMLVKVHGRSGSKNMCAAALHPGIRDSCSPGETKNKARRQDLKMLKGLQILFDG